MLIEEEKKGQINSDGPNDQVRFFDDESSRTGHTGYGAKTMAGKSKQLRKLEVHEEATTDQHSILFKRKEEKLASRYNDLYTVEMNERERDLK